MTSHYKRTWLMQYMRYTFPVGVRLVFASLLNIALLFGGGFYWGQYYTASKCVATAFVCILLVYMLVNMLRFINYKKFNK